MKTRSFALIAGFAALAAAPAAFADEIQCRGNLGAIAVDNVFVPDGAQCIMDRTRLKGSLVVGRGSQLVARGVSVNGNVQAEGAASVALLNFSLVGGSVQLVQGYAATIDRARITGDLSFDENAGRIVASGNRIGGSLQAFQNRGGIAIRHNVMNGNLQCKENVPAPTGGGNVSPSKEDQCESL